MKTMSATHELETGDIKVLSNLTSITANANRISRIEAVEGQETKYPSAIHIDFQVKPHPEHLPTVLGEYYPFLQRQGLYSSRETEELDLVIGLDDAVQIGMLLLAMGLENKSELEVDEVFKRLFELASEFHS